MKNISQDHNRGFTLIEIIIAVTISTIIMGGVLVFLIQIQKDITTSKQSTRVRTSMTDFIGTMNNFKKIYPETTIISTASGTYNVGLLTNPKKTSGILLGVVDQKEGNVSKLTADKSTYGKKVIAYQKLNATQIGALTPANTYDILFQDAGLFPELLATNFTISKYNTGAIFEYTMDIEAPYHEALSGRARDSLDLDVATFSFTLDF